MKKLFGLFSKDKKKDENQVIAHLASKYQPSFHNHATDVQLYVCGSGETRPIGSHQTKTKVPIFDSIKFEDTTIASQIKDVRCCDAMGFHFIFMATMHDNTIKLFGVGQNINGELTADTTQDVEHFREIETASITNNGRNTITHVACGYTESAVVTDNKEVFVTGSLGLTRQFKKVKLPFESEIMKLQASFYTMFILTDQGEVYELTRGQEVQVKKEASGVINMEIGGYHYVLIYKNGDIETRKCNQHYHTGTTTTPIKIHGETVEKIKCGWWTTYLVTSSRKIFMARNDFTNFAEIPMHPNVTRIDKICVPIDDLLLLSDGKLFAKGENAYRVLGIDGPCSVMTDINLVEQLSRSPGTKVIDVRHSYIASYLVLGKFAVLDLLKVWKKEAHPQQFVTSQPLALHKMNESVPMKHAQNYVLPPPAPIFNPTKSLTPFAPFTPAQTNSFVLNNNIVKLVGTIPTVADPRALPSTLITTPPTEITQNVPQPTHARGQLLNGCRVVLYGKDFENLQKDLMETVKDNGGISYAATYEHMQNSTKNWIRNMQVRVVNENWLVDTIEANALQDVALYKLRNEDDFEVETPKPPQEKRAARPKIMPVKKKRSLPESESPPPERTKRQRKVAQRASSKRFDQSWVTDFDEEHYDEVSDEPVSEEEEPEVEIDENDHNATYTLLDILATCERLESIEPKKIAPPPPRKRDPPPGEVLKWTIEQTQNWLTDKVSTDEQDAEVLQQWAKRELIDGEALLELDTMEYLKHTDFALGTKLRIQNAVLGLKANKST